MYYSQCLETQIGIMLSTMYNVNFFDSSMEERDIFFEKNLSKTLGAMEKDLENRASLPPNLEVKLKDAVKLRNWLAHRYFYERGKDILLSDGRERMILELQEKVDFLKNVDEEFVNILKVWRRDKGISDEQVQEEMQKLLSDSNISF